MVEFEVVPGRRRKEEVRPMNQEKGIKRRNQRRIKRERKKKGNERRRGMKEKSKSSYVLMKWNDNRAAEISDDVKIMQKALERPKLKKRSW